MLCAGGRRPWCTARLLDTVVVVEEEAAASRAAGGTDNAPGSSLTRPSFARAARFNSCLKITPHLDL